MTQDYDQRISKLEQMVGMGNQPRGHALCRVSILSDSHCILPIFHQGMHRDNQGFERCPWCHNETSTWGHKVGCPIGTSSVPTTGPVKGQSESSIGRLSVPMGNLAVDLESYLREVTLAYFRFHRLPQPVMEFQKDYSTNLLKISIPLISSTSETKDVSPDSGAAPSQDGRWSVVSWPFYGDNANHSKRHFGLVSNKEGYHIALGDTDEAMARQHCEYLNGSV